MLPDHTVDATPETFAELVLVGGESWRKAAAEAIFPLIDRALALAVPLVIICPTVFADNHGYLNDKKHTSNFKSKLLEASGSAYTNQANYVLQDAVRDGNLVAANGRSPVKFGKLMLEALDAAPPIKRYNFNTLGLISAVEKHYPQRRNPSYRVSAPGKVTSDCLDKSGYPSGRCGPIALRASQCATLHPSDELRTAFWCHCRLQQCKPQ